MDAALAATPAQRLEWLEAALKLAYDAGALPANTAGTDAESADQGHREEGRSQT